MSVRKADSNYAFAFPSATVSFDAQAFDDALGNHGVKMIHWRAMKCPVGMIDRYEHRRVHEDHAGCSNGHIYTRAGCVTGIFTSNTNKIDQNEIGLLDGSTVVVTLPRTYDDDSCEISVVPFDRFYLTDEAITVPHQQLVEAHVTGKDKLSFPVVKVIDVIDSQGKRYAQDDLDIDEKGLIVWHAGKGPGMSLANNRGNIYSIRYTYRPYWYCDRLMHQVRVAQVDDGIERKVVRMPQQFALQREYVFEKSDRDDKAPDSNDPRQVKGPAQAFFGPR